MILFSGLKGMVRFIMGGINDAAAVKIQYNTSNNLNTRISIHDKYSTNKMGFGNWIVQTYWRSAVEPEICGKTGKL